MEGWLISHFFFLICAFWLGCNFSAKKKKKHGLLLQLGDKLMSFVKITRKCKSSHESSYSLEAILLK